MTAPEAKRNRSIYGPRQANLCLRAFRHDKFQMRMSSHLEGPMLVWASSGGSGETARMRRLAWTFAARIGDKYQIRWTRPIYKTMPFKSSSEQKKKKELYTQIILKVHSERSKTHQIISKNETGTDEITVHTPHMQQLSY